MKVDWANDIGAPAAVTVVNVMARASETQIGNTPIADVATYAMAAGGYLLAYMGWGSANIQSFSKNVAIAAAPLAFEKLYNMIKGTPVTSRVTRPVSMSRVSRYPGPASQSSFQGIRLT